MKSLKSILETSILADIDDQLEAGDEAIEKYTIDSIQQFIRNNYYFSTGSANKYTISKKPNKDGKYEVSSKHSVTLINRNCEYLTNDLFVWKKVKTFDCSECLKLKSLVGAPIEVVGSFICNGCKSLTSLEGAPKEVGINFECSFCKKLKSLEGAPEELFGMFYCNSCPSLTSLKGAPQKVKCFDCTGCKNLDSLKGAPKEITSYIFCRNCKVKFTEDDVKSVSNVGFRIYC